MFNFFIIFKPLDEVLFFEKLYKKNVFFNLFHGAPSVQKAPRRLCNEFKYWKSIGSCIYGGGEKLDTIDTFFGSERQTVKKYQFSVEVILFSSNWYYKFVFGHTMCYLLSQI